MAHATSGTPPPQSVFDGPAAPIPPAVISRDESGRVTARAVRLDTPLRLDELAYESVPPMSGLIQVGPHAGEPATQQTDLWVFFDNENV